MYQSRKEFLVTCGILSFARVFIENIQIMVV